MIHGDIWEFIISVYKLFFFFLRWSLNNGNRGIPMGVNKNGGMCMTKTTHGDTL